MGINSVAVRAAGMQDLSTLPTRRPVTHMNPVVSILVNELVERQPQLQDESKQPLIIFWPVTQGSDVGGLAKRMLAVGGPTDQSVQTRGAETAGDNNGFTPGFPKRVEHLLTQTEQSVSLHLVGLVVHATPPRCGRGRHLLKSKKTCIPFHVVC